MAANPIDFNKIEVVRDCPSLSLLEHRCWYMCICMETSYKQMNYSETKYCSMSLQS
uniref:Uncharacterized protein n=1 Tax=Arundo donax TaxID=35708 RepID=A0A0A9DI69_ARUDO